MLDDHGVIEASDEQYAKLHFLTDSFERNRETFEEIAATADVEPTGSDDDDGSAGGTADDSAASGVE